MGLESTADTDTGIFEHRIDLAKSYLRARAPGLLDILNTYFIHTYGKDVFTLLLESPCIVYSTVSKIARDEDMTKHILVYVLLKPLMSMLDQEEQQRLRSNIAKCTDIDLQWYKE